MTDKSAITQKELLPIPPFRVMTNEYTSPFLCIQGASKRLSVAIHKIPGLSNIIADNKKLSFILSFPFQEEAEFTIYPIKEGFSKLQVINEIRRAHRSMFRQRNEIAAQWETVSSKGKVKSYLVAYPFSGIYVERVYLIKDWDRLDIKVNCGPEIQGQDNLPF